MKKNDFMILNDLIFQLYTEKSFCEVKLTLLKRLKLLIPYSYASILMAREENDRVILSDPLCIPSEFVQAENEYIATVNTDQLDWVLYSPESVLIRESVFTGDERRPDSTLYQKCYRNYHIYDTLQLTIVNERKLYAILTLYRTKSDGIFTGDDELYLRSLSKHLNFVFYSHLRTDSPSVDTVKIKAFSEHFGLTRRESEILGFIMEYLDNEEMLELIPISEHTLQKHMQNIYRKCEVSSKLELLRLCAKCG